MAITEQERHRMYQRLEELLGAQAAATLMEHLPPVGWADVSTNRDLESVETSLRRDLEALEASLRRDLEALEASLRHEIALVRAEMSTLRFELTGQMAELRAATERGLRQQTLALLGGIAALTAAAVAAGGLL